MPHIVRAFPVLAGKLEELRRFTHELETTRAAEIAGFFHRFGVERESWHIQETDHGTWVIAVTWLGGRPADEAGREYAASHEPFDRWFKEQVLALTGIDPDREPLGPPTTCLFDTHQSLAGHGFGS
jgi:hypothetical protein